MSTSPFQSRINVFGSVYINGQVNSQAGEIVLYSDSTLKKAAYDINLTTGSVVSAFKAIEDHSVSPAVRYEFTDSKCEKKPPTLGTEPYCIPGTVKLLGNVVIGDPNTNQNVTVYSYASGPFTGKIAISPRNIPAIQEQVINYGPTSLEQTLVYYDAKTSIIDPSVFEIPALCKQQIPVA